MTDDDAPGIDPRSRTGTNATAVRWLEEGRRVVAAVLVEVVADLDRVDGELLEHFAVHRLDVLAPQPAARDVGLIGDDDQREAGVAEPRDGFVDSVEDAEIFDAAR